MTERGPRLGDRRSMPDGLGEAEYRGWGWALLQATDEQRTQYAQLDRKYARQGQFAELAESLGAQRQLYFRSNLDGSVLARYSLDPENSRVIDVVTHPDSRTVKISLMVSTSTVFPEEMLGDLDEVKRRLIKRVRTQMELLIDPPTDFTPVVSNDEA